MMQHTHGCPFLSNFLSSAHTDEDETDTEPILGFFLGGTGGPETGYILKQA
jgi:hypothetical protein